MIIAILKFKIVISLRFKDIINKSWHLLQTFGCNLKPLFKKYSVWIIVVWYVKVCIFRKCIQYTIHWDKIQILKNFPSDKINSTKNALFFLSQAPKALYFFHKLESFTFKLGFLYELKHKVCLSKTICGIFHFQFRFIFIKIYIFFFIKMHELFDFKTS